MPASGAAASQQATQDPLRVNTLPTLNHVGARLAKQDVSLGPKTSTGIPSDLSKFGGMYEQGHSSQDRQPIFSAKSAQEQSDTPRTLTHPRSAPLRQNSGFKLPSVAYSPNVNEDNASSEEEDEAGEEELVENATKREMSRPLGARTTMPLSPPKLPLLFFEEGSIGQLDFAYQSSPGALSSTHSQTFSPGGDSAKGSKRYTEDASISYSSDEDEQSVIVNNRGTQATNHGTANRASSKPSAPVINTTFPPQATQHPIKQEVHTPERDEGHTSDTQCARGQSFYWASPGSGSGSDEEEEEADEDEYDSIPTAQANGTIPNQAKGAVGSTASEGAGQTVEPLVIKPIVNTIKQNSLTSATALGFGGPSDWQHFNDYDAEEVDDLALYISDKPKTAELPAGTPVKEDADIPDAGLVPRRLVALERDALSTIQERASEVIEDGKSPEADQAKTSDRSSAASTESQESAQRSLIERPATQQSSLISNKPSTASLQANPDDTVSINSAKASTIKSTTNETKTEPETTVPEKTSTSLLPAKHSRMTSNPSVQSSGLNSPIDEDDGREHIIISLQMPESPGKDSTKESSPPKTTAVEEGSRERNAITTTLLEPKIVESPELLRTGRMSVFPQSIEMEDPYAGLDPWAKASLNRYVKLLKEEAAAQNDEEKFTLFINFMDRERRNRTALYDMDDDSENESTVQFNKVKDDSGKVRSRVSLKRKAPLLIPSADTMPTHILEDKPIVRADTMPPPGVSERQNSESSVSNIKSTENTQTPTTAPPQQSSFNATPATEASVTAAEPPFEDKRVSVVPRQLKEKASSTFTDRGSTYKPKEKIGSKTGLSLSALKKKALDLGGRSIAKDRSPTPNNLLSKASDDGKKSTSPATTNRNGSTVTTPSPVPPPGKVDSPATSVTTDVRSDGPDKNDEAEGRQYEGDKAANRQTIYRPFSGHLRQSSILRGSNPDSKRSSVFDRKSLAAEAALSRPPVPPLNIKPFEDYQKPRTKSVNYRYTILEPLLLVLPQEGITHSEPPQLTRLRQDMDSIRDDFSFIHKTVLAWDAEAKKGRDRNEKERLLRTNQNEAHIDALFNDNEIGYGDISQLEADFKRQEATKKAQEDREEVDTFVMNVFDVVWKRINYEMDQLQPLYDQCTELVTNASAGRAMFEELDDAVPVASSMEVLLILYQKLMVRHQKAFEAVLERDRRLKKTEVAPWTAMGSNEKVKKIEKRFEDAEKKAILEFCRQRDERAGFLMEVLDHNTLRGVGANQDYMESIMQAVRRVSTDIQANGSSINKDDVVSRDEVLKAQTITTSLARSSEQLVQTFHVADMLLNAADYEVSVANAKLSNADAAAFKRLREAKAKEDSKLVMDLEHRMNLIRGDTTRTQEEINKLLSVISTKTDGEGIPGSSGERQGSTGSVLEDQDRNSRVLAKGAEDTSTGKNKRLLRR